MTNINRTVNKITNKRSVAVKKPEPLPLPIPRIFEVTHVNRLINVVKNNKIIIMDDNIKRL